MNQDHPNLKAVPADASGTELLSESFLRSAVPYWLATLVTAATAILLYLISRHNYLLFHTLVETFFVAVSFTVFSIGWNARKFTQDNSLLILSIAYVTVGSLEILHIISFRGMGIFPEIGANAATQIWIAARYLEALAFVGAALGLGRKNQLPPWGLLLAFLTTGLLVSLSIWPLDLFPDCYLDGSGLTPFKITSELLISTIFGLAILLFWKNRQHLHSRVLKLLTAALVFSILAEFAFSLYLEIYGVTNFVGHFAKFVSVVLIYRVLVIGTLRSPYATLFRDLSLAKHALDLELDQRKKTEAELRTTNRELDAFVRTVSHDLRTPLTPIIGLPELLLSTHKDQFDEASQKSLLDIREQGLRMARILEDLLVFARAGRMLEGVAAVDIEEGLQKVLEELGSQIIASGIGIKIHPLPKADLPRTALFQIFSNLILNAVKYAGPGGGPIEIGGCKIGDAIEIYVRDHGPGIPADQHVKIFDVFFRGSAASDKPGSGIGLATVQKIAECLDGKARIEETPGGGATFIIRLRKPATEQQQLDFYTAGGS